MPTRLFPPFYQFEDGNGRPLSGGTLEFYASGTSTPKSTFADAGQTIPNGTITLNALGRSPVPIFASTGAYRVVLKDPNGVVIGDDDPIDGAAAEAQAPGAGIRNLLTDGDFANVLTLTTAAADGQFIADSWYALTQTANATVELQTLSISGIPNNLRLTQSAGAPQRMGFAQIVPAADTYRLRSGAVTLSGKVRFSFTAPIRYAILSWSGTADEVTRDVVLDWSSSNYTPGNFFISTTLSIVGVGAITPAAGAWTDIAPMAGPVSSATTNLIVVFWTEGTVATGGTLDAAQIQLEAGIDATAYEFLPIADPFTRQSYVDAGDRWVQISSTAITSVAEIDLTWTGGAYRLYRIFLLNARPVSATANQLYMRFYRGGVLQSGASDYQRTNAVWDGATGSVSTGGLSYMILTTGSNGEPAYAEIDLSQPSVGESILAHAKARWTSNTPAHATGLMTCSVGAGSGWLSGVKMSFVGATPSFAATGQIVVMGLKS